MMAYLDVRGNIAGGIPRPCRVRSSQRALGLGMTCYDGILFILCILCILLLFFPIRAGSLTGNARRKLRSLSFPSLLNQSCWVSPRHV